MGMMGYYSRFIEGFSKLAVPFMKLLWESSKFEWTDECEASFYEIKK